MPRPTRSSSPTGCQRHGPARSCVASYARSPKATSTIWATPQRWRTRRRRFAGQRTGLSPRVLARDGGQKPRSTGPRKNAHEPVVSVVLMPRPASARRDEGAARRAVTGAHMRAPRRGVGRWAPPRVSAWGSRRRPVKGPGQEYLHISGRRSIPSGGVRPFFTGVEYCPNAPSSRLASRAPRRPEDCELFLTGPSETRKQRRQTGCPARTPGSRIG